MKLAFVFKTTPHGSVVSREGLDALLASTAFCDEDQIGVFFLDDGIFNLVAHQQPELILQKNFIPTFKLLDLYDIENRFVCSLSLEKFNLSEAEFILNCKKIDRTLLVEKLRQAEKILTF